MNTFKNMVRVKLYEFAIICKEHPNPQEEILFRQTDDENCYMGNKALEESRHRREVKRPQFNQANEQERSLFSSTLCKWKTLSPIYQDSLSNRKNIN